ncbi:MAG: Ig-like domain-containing protein [Gemmatimonadetes bacterium]|nr:Ig-like domain-containing protein [Gemmatimonadota bacterium]
MNQRLLLMFVGLSLFALTACGKDSPTEPEPTEPPPAPVPTRIVVAPSSVTLDAIGQSAELTAQVFDQNNVAMAGAVASWTSGDAAVAAVSTTGLVTAVGNGSTEIKAMSGNASASVIVTVMQTAHSIVIEPQTVTLKAAGETVQLIATVLDRNEQPIVGAAIAWASDDTGVATVDDDGLVTAVGSGDARITATNSGFSATVPIEVDIAHPDRATLITLYNALDGPNWTRSTNWLSDLPLGAWHGVETDGDGRVTGLNLGFNNLGGDIPPELGNLTNLQELDLHENVRLSCRIPSELGHLTNLRRLYVFSIPVLTAEFPPSWDPVPNPSCPIPPELGNLANLEVLHLGFKQFSGSIPLELGNLANLQRLDIGFNALSGSIPPALGKLTNLRFLGLGYNTLSGNIPPELGKLTNLHELRLDLNDLSGNVPPELGKLSELTILALAGNEHLSGPLPNEIFGLENLESLSTFLTGLCLPPDIDPAVLAWLERVLFGPVVFCEAM